MTNLFSFDSDPASTSNLQALMTWARGVDERMYAYNENLLNLIASMDALAFLLIDAKSGGINCSVILPVAFVTALPAESVTCCTKFFDVSLSVFSMLFCTFVITDGSLAVFCIFAGILSFNAANLSVGFEIVDNAPVAELVRPEKNPVAPPTILLPADLKDVNKFLVKPVIPLNNDLPIFVMLFICINGII